MKSTDSVNRIVSVHIVEVLWDLYQLTFDAAFVSDILCSTKSKNNLYNYCSNRKAACFELVRFTADVLHLPVE